MSTLAEWISEEADGETIEGVVIGEMGWGDYGKENIPGYDEQPKNKLLTWDQAVQYLSYDFDSGFGAPGCNAITAWTHSKVMFIVQYDGATGIYSVPRHPCDHIPEMPGG